MCSEPFFCPWICFWVHGFSDTARSVTKTLPLICLKTRIEPGRNGFHDNGNKSPCDLPFEESVTCDAQVVGRCDAFVGNLRYSQMA
jgi:hypothetical protein